MTRLVPIGIMAASIVVGALLGESTVSAMSVTRVAGDDTAVGADQRDAGYAWAEQNHPQTGDSCPGPSTLFQSACMANTAN